MTRFTLASKEVQDCDQKCSAQSQTRLAANEVSHPAPSIETLKNDTRGASNWTEMF